MILYVNGDSHTAAAEAVNNHAFAEDDTNYWHLERRPHPDNLAVSWGKLLAERLKANFYCDAESASSNDRIMRTTKQWIQNNDKNLYRTLIILQWSTWEREEWLINDKYYQVNASGIDVVPESHQQQYKEYIANLDWQKKTHDAHLKIWNFHLWLQTRNINHIFFNGNNDFSEITTLVDWKDNYLEPYNKTKTFNSIVGEKYDTVSPTSWHYGADAHRFWANYLLKYCIEKDFI